MKRQSFLSLYSLSLFVLLTFSITELNAQEAAQAAQDPTEAAPSDEKEKADVKAETKEKPAADLKATKKADANAKKKKAAVPAAKVKPAKKAKPAKKGNEAGAALGNLIKGAFEAIGGGGRKAANKAAKLVEKKLDENDPVVKQFMRNYSRQFNQIYKTELHLVRIVCNPTKQEFQQIAKDGEAAKKETILQFARYQKRMQRGWRAGQEPKQPGDPRALLAEELYKSVSKRLSPEQAKSYRGEVDRRNVARKRVAKLNLLAKFDKRLVLTPDQRTKFSELLDKNWKSSWNNVQMMMYGEQYFPQIQSSKVTPILNETQKSVWRGIAKQSTVYYGFNIFMVNGVQIQDEVWEDDEPQEEDAPPQDAKNRDDGKAAAVEDDAAVQEDVATVKEEAT